MRLFPTPSRLSTLANTIDSRGWAIKNVNVNLYSQPLPQIVTSDSDRLLSMTDAPQQVPDYDVQAADDILDETNNPIAQQFQHMIEDSEQSHRQKIKAMMDNEIAAEKAQATNDQTNANWFMAPPTELPPTSDQAARVPAAVGVPAADPTADEMAVAEHIKQVQAQPAVAFNHMKTVRPLDDAAQVAAPAQPGRVTPAPNPATVLATDNDKNIDVLAREAKRINHEDTSEEEGEVVISLR